MCKVSNIAGKIEQEACILHTYVQLYMCTWKSFQKQCTYLEMNAPTNQAVDVHIYRVRAYCSIGSTYHESSCRNKKKVKKACICWIITCEPAIDMYQADVIYLSCKSLLQYWFYLPRINKEVELVGA